MARRWRCCHETRRDEKREAGFRKILRRPSRSRSLRQDSFAYVDKTGLIDDILAEGAQVLLVPRPRRFGKTLNLSMLRYFFEKSPDDARPLFAGLAVASSVGAWKHFHRYPVIFMTFKDVKRAPGKIAWRGLANVLAGAYKDHRYLLTKLDRRIDENIVPRDVGARGRGVELSALHRLSEGDRDSHGRWPAVVFARKLRRPSSWAPALALR